MAASWSKDSDEKTNFTKLSRLLIDGGTVALRIAFERIHPPSTLVATLHAQLSVLKTLRFRAGGRKRPVLTPDQWNKLYPSPASSAPTSQDFDITLLFILLRNICALKAPATGWDKLPSSSNNSLEANLVRIKYYRNQVYGHVSRAAVDSTKFEQYWRDISCALVPLGIDKVDIDVLKTSPIGETDYFQLLKEWRSSDAEIVEEVRGIIQKIDDIGSKIDQNNLQQKAFFGEMEAKSLHMIYKSEFSSHIDKLCRECNAKTRSWLLDEIFTLTDSKERDSQLVLLTAPPGMGKSTVAAMACKSLQEQGRLAACHFFQYNVATRDDPRKMLQSIARQLCDSIPGFTKSLGTKLQSVSFEEISKMNCASLFTVLFEEPFCELAKSSPREETLVVVIDALDECSKEGKDELLHVLARRIDVLPPWLRFCFTARPSKNISDICPSSAFKTLELYPGDLRNDEDICIYIKNELTELYQGKDDVETATCTEELSRKSGGFFVFAHFVIEDIKNSNFSLREIEEIFPSGLSSVYERYFSRLKDGLGVSEDTFFHALAAVVAAEDPLPKDLFLSILGLKKEGSRQDKKARREALKSLQLLFPVENDHVTVFHKSVFDWLSQDGEDEHDFSVSVCDGREVLARHCLDVLVNLKGRIDYNAELVVDDNERYALHFGIMHMHKCIAFKEETLELSCDFDILASMCVAESDDFWVGFEKMSFIHPKLGDLHLQLSQLGQALNGHSALFRCYLEIVIQCVLDTKPTVDMVEMAHKVLQEHNLPYVEADVKCVKWNVGGDDTRVTQGSDCNTNTTVEICFKNPYGRTHFQCGRKTVVAFTTIVGENTYTTVRVFEKDIPVVEKSLPGIVVPKHVSTDNKHLALSNNGVLELRDLPCLDLMSFTFPANALPAKTTVWIVGGEQWKVVIGYNGTIHVINGITGTTEYVIEGRKYLVSSTGYILTSDNFQFHLCLNKDFRKEIDIRNAVVREDSLSSDPTAFVVTGNIVFSPDGSVLVVFDEAHYVHVFDTSSGNKHATWYAGWNVTTAYFDVISEHHAIISMPPLQSNMFCFFNILSGLVEHVLYFPSPPASYRRVLHTSQDEVVLLKMDYNSLSKLVSHNMGFLCGQ